MTLLSPLRWRNQTLTWFPVTPTLGQLEQGEKEGTCSKNTWLDAEMFHEDTLFSSLET